VEEEIGQRLRAAEPSAEISRGSELASLQRGHAATLLDWLRWAQRGLVGFGVFFLLLFAVLRSPASLIIGIFLLALIAPAIRFSAHLVARGRVNWGLACATGTIWICALGPASRGAVTLAIAVTLTFLPVIIAVPHLGRRDLLRMVICASVWAGVCATVAGTGPWLESTLPDRQLGLLAVPILLVGVGLAMFAIWHVSSHLLESLSEVQVSNQALRDSEQLLERKVEERTAELGTKNQELEAALVEVSDVDEIIQTANTTLDVGRVVEVALGAIQKIFPSHLAGVGLLDERREFLHFGYPKGDWTQESLDAVNELQLPVSEPSSFSHVVQNVQPFFLTQIAPAVVAAMSDNDRSLFDAVAPKALLICPLEVESEAIGFIIFVNCREEVHLERLDVQRIRRYVRPLATAIRNARLFEETTAALEETADIDQIAQTVIATLDLNRVASQVMETLQHVFPFDQMAIGLLDEQRNLRLENALGAGFEEVREQFVGTILPADERSSVFNYVARSGEPIFARDLTPELVTSPTDQLLQQATSALSALTCPLQIEGKVVGVIYFGNSVERMDLDDAAITKIRRYLTLLSTAIRNARLFDEAEAARAAAIEATQAKSQFLANMSHELRTPLTAIIGYAEMIREDAAEQLGEYLEDLDQILSSSNYLLELIGTVLDLSKIEAGKMEVYLETCEVADLVNGVADTIQPLVQKNSNQLVLGGLAELGSMHTDVTKVRQSLFNLLSNASKFTEGGEVQFDAERATEAGRDWLTFRVIDSGIGMTQEQCDQVFESFAQADASTTKEYGGTGLGLAISKQFCEMLGGSIEVASEFGQGTTFTARLPAQTPVENPAQPPHPTEAA
jgi:signal transduction histidine kinase